MPNVDPKIRSQLESRAPMNSAELAYAICAKIQEFLDSTPNGGFEGTISKVYGALEATREAFYEEVVRPYEDIKRRDNGPVFNWQGLNR